MAKKKFLKKQLSISAFFPCFNDAGSIGLIVEDAYETLRKVCSDFEVIVVDDYSKDESKIILRRLKKKYKSLRLILHKENVGYGGALKSGFKAAKKEYVFYTDGDGQYDAKELLLLTSRISHKADIIQGYKIKRFDPWYRLILGRLYHYLSKLLFGLKIRDVDCDFRLIRKSALKTLNLEYNSGVICVELVKKLQDKGYKFREVGVHHYPRFHGHSQFFNYKRIIKTLFELSQLWLKLVILKYE